MVAHGQPTDRPPVDLPSSRRGQLVDEPHGRRPGTRWKRSTQRVQIADIEQRRGDGEDGELDPPISLTRHAHGDVDPCIRHEDRLDLLEVDLEPVDLDPT